MRYTMLYPLRFEPIFKAALWGGRKLRPFFGVEPSEEPTGEAWVLSDQGDSASVIAEGPLRGATLRDVMEQMPARLLGHPPAAHGRFPLLLKFLDAQLPLSVQVHPNDEQAARMSDPSKGLGKTEAWVVLESEPGSRIYSGLRDGVTRERMCEALRTKRVEETLHSFTPSAGDCVFLSAGTVHAIGAGLMLFEVQQTSDITYRFYDWGRVDAKTGQPRQLHVDESLECTDFARGPCDPVRSILEPHEHARRERLVSCRYFTLHRWLAERPYVAGQEGRCRILVGIQGRSHVVHAGRDYPLNAGDVILIPAEVGACACVPEGQATILECGIPDRAEQAACEEAA